MASCAGVSSGMWCGRVKLSFPYPAGACSQHREQSRRARETKRKTSAKQSPRVSQTLSKTFRIRILLFTLNPRGFPEVLVVPGCRSRKSSFRPA